MAASMKSCPAGSRAGYRSYAPCSRKPDANKVKALRSRLFASSSHLSQWDDCRQGTLCLQECTPSTISTQGVPKREVVRMGNKGAGGVFSPLVVAVRAVVGEKEFNKLRGQAISLHSQVIKDFGKQLGADPKQVQGVIRLAKKNGEWLGFLA